MRRMLPLLSLIVSLLLPPLAGLAQPAENGVADPDAERPRGGVYVPDSDEALQKIRRAEVMAKAGEWDHAAQLLHEVLVRYSDKVLSRGDNLYVSVIDGVNERLADWPEEGLEVYRRRYDALARKAYEEAAATGNCMDMAQVARRYWVSSIGGRAADEAAELAVESGCFATAIDLWTRVLVRPSANGLDKAAIPPILAKLAVVCCWAGQGEQAARFREQLSKQYGDWPNTFGNRQGTLVDWVGQFSSPLSGQSQTVRLGLHPTFGGATGRNGIAAGEVTFGQELWSFDKHKSGNANSRNGRAMLTNNNTGRRQVVDSMILPVLVGGKVLFDSPTGVYCINANSGTLIWANNSMADQSRSSATSYGVQMTRMYAPTWSDGRLYVDFGSPVLRTAWSAARGGGESGMACLDAETGKTLWTFKTSDYEELRGGYCDPAPLAMGGRLFVAVHVVRSVFDNCVVVALDGRTGKLLWKQHVTEGDSGNGYSYMRSQPVIIAGEGNSIFLTTNLGTVASLAADDGMIRWLRQYGRRVVDNNNRIQIQRNNILDIDKLAPATLWNGQVITVPSDADRLLVLDAQDGRVIHSVETKKLYGLNEIYGVVDGQLIGQGDEVVAVDLKTARSAWHIRPDAEPTARGWMTQKYLYLPAAKQLLRLDLAARGRTELFEWPKGKCDGTVLLTDQYIITLRDDRVAGFCDWALAERLSLAAIARNPDRPDPYLDYAENAYATKKMQLAHQQLTRGVEVAGGFEMLNQEALKRRVFNDALDFARAAWKDEPLALQLLEMSSMCPPDVEAHVRYRVAMAEYWTDYQQPVTAVRYYQEILNDPSMRSAGYQVDENYSEDAGRRARRSIDLLITRHGQAVYQTVAAQADQAYQRARGSQDWKQVQKLVLQYPNATRTRREVMDLAAHFAGGTQYKEAIDWVAFLRREYGEQIKGPEDVEALTQGTRYALAMFQQWQDRQDVDDRQRRAQQRRAIHHAYRFLGNGRVYQDARVELEGVQAGFEAHRERIAQAYPRMLDVLPQVNAGLALSRTVTLSGNAQMLKPLLSDSSPGDEVALLNVMSGQSRDIAGYRANKAGMAWPGPRKYDASQGTPMLVTYYDDLAVIAQAHRIKGLDPTTGEIAWSVECRDDRARQTHLRLFARHEHILCAASQNVVMIVDLDAQKSLQDIVLPDMLVAQPTVDERYVAYLARDGGNMHITVLDWRTGKVVRKIDDPANDGVWVELADDLLLVGGRMSLTCYDINSGKQVWRQALPGHVNGNTNYAVRNNMVYVACWVNEWRLAAYDFRSKGKRLWEHRIGQKDQQGFVRPVRLLLYEDELYVVGDYQNFFSARSADTGQESWEPVTNLSAEDEVIRDVFISQDYIAVMYMTNNRRIVNGRIPKQTCTVRLFDRTPGGGANVDTVSLEIQGYGVTGFAPMSPGLAVQAQNTLHILQPKSSKPPGEKKDK